MANRAVGSDALFIISRSPIYNVRLSLGAAVLVGAKALILGSSMRPQRKLGLPILMTFPFPYQPRRQFVLLAGCFTLTYLAFHELSRKQEFDPKSSNDTQGFHCLRIEVDQPFVEEPCIPGRGVKGNLVKHA